MIIGAFVSLFLFVFKPFGIEELNPPFWKFLGFGLVTFIGVSLVHFVAPKIFLRFFDEKNYTLGKELFISAIMIIIIAIGNALYNNYFMEPNPVGSIFIMIYHTFLVGIFPLTFVALISYNRQLRNNLKTSQEIKIPNNKTDLNPSINQKNKVYQVPVEDQQTSIISKEILYIESVGNYANVVQFQENEIIKNLYRTTLKSLEAENDTNAILRCHRSFIANLEQVVEIKGNAQGLKLHLKNCPQVIPVSRKYIPKVKTYFEKLN